MRVSNCRACGEYRYLESKGVCRKCFPSCAIEPLSARAKAGFGTVDLNKLENSIKGVDSDRFANSMRYGLKPDEDSVKIMEFSGADEPNLTVTRNGRCRIEHYNPELCKETYDMVKKQLKASQDIEVKSELSMTEVVCTVDFESEPQESIVDISQDLHKMSNTLLVRGDNMDDCQQTIDHVQEFLINKNI